jgi:hypothetical protein
MQVVSKFTVIDRLIIIDIGFNFSFCTDWVLAIDCDETRVLGSQ